MVEVMLFKNNKKIEFLLTFCSCNLHKAALFLALFLGVQLSSYALESTVELHKGSDSATYGFSLGVTDSFFKQKAFNWRVSYNRLNDVAVDWNAQNVDFSIDTVDLLLTYRYSPRSYNKFINKLTLEFQGGAAVTLTENKFVFPNLANFEKVFSEQGDVNVALGFLVNYKTSTATSVHVGMKYYPDYSEFGAVTSAFVGFNYHFGRKTGY